MKQTDKSSETVKAGTSPTVDTALSIPTIPAIPAAEARQLALEALALVGTEDSEDGWESGAKNRRIPFPNGDGRVKREDDNQGEGNTESDSKRRRTSRAVGSKLSSNKR